VATGNVTATSLNVSGISTQAQINCIGVATGIVSCTDLNCSGPGSFAGLEAVSTQGLHTQWNRGFFGGSFIMNQKGGGTGGINIGEVTSGDVFTAGLIVQSTPAASATVVCPTGRLDVSGASGNGAIPTQGFAVITTALGTATYINCAPGGFGLIDFVESGVQGARILYEPGANALYITNEAATGGGTFYEGQNTGTVVRKPPQYLGGSVGNQNAISVNTNYITTSVDAVWDSGVPLKTSIVLPSRGHWQLYAKAQLISASNTSVFVWELYVDAVLTEQYFQSAASGEYACMTGMLFLDCKADGSLVELKTQGAGTSGASSTFELVAIRIG